jgi:hypothetical protein
MKSVLTSLVLTVAIFGLGSGVASAAGAGPHQAYVQVSNGSRGCRPSFPALFVSFPVEQVKPTMTEKSSGQAYNVPVYPGAGVGGTSFGWHAQAVIGCLLPHPIEVDIAWTPDGAQTQAQTWIYAGIPGFGGHWTRTA